MPVVRHRGKHCQKPRIIRYFPASLAGSILLDIGIGIGHLLVLWAVARYIRTRLSTAPLRWAFLPGMVYKVVMGWLLGLLFMTYYPSGDTIHYFSDGRVLAELSYQQPAQYLRVLAGLVPPPAVLVFLDQPRALFFAKCVSVVNIFTYNNYWITSLYFSLLSFLASWLLANDLSRRFPRQRYAAAIAFLAYPSVVFWGSGILKESIAVAAIMCIIFLVLRWRAKAYNGVQWVFRWLLLLVAVWLLWKVKYYYAAVLLPTLLAALLTWQVGRKWNTVAVLAGFIVSWLTLIGLASLLHPRLAINHLLAVLVHNHDTIVQLSDATNIIHFVSLDERVWSFVRNIPLAIASALFRPMLWEGTNHLQWVAGLENTVLAVLFIVALVTTRWNHIRSSNPVWIIATVAYIIVLGSLLAFASPNFGSLVRYRVAFLPFFVYLCLTRNQWLIDWFAKKADG